MIHHFWNSSTIFRVVSVREPSSTTITSKRFLSQFCCSRDARVTQIVSSELKADMITEMIFWDLSTLFSMFSCENDEIGAKRGKILRDDYIDFIKYAMFFPTVEPPRSLYIKNIEMMITDKTRETRPSKDSQVSNRFSSFTKKPKNMTVFFPETHLRKNWLDTKKNKYPIVPRNKIGCSHDEVSIFFEYPMYLLEEQICIGKMFYHFTTKNRIKYCILKWENLREIMSNRMDASCASYLRGCF